MKVSPYDGMHVVRSHSGSEHSEISVEQSSHIHDLIKRPPISDEDHQFDFSKKQLGFKKDLQIAEQPDSAATVKITNGKKFSLFKIGHEV